MSDDPSPNPSNRGELKDRVHPIIRKMLTEDRDASFVALEQKQVEDQERGAALASVAELDITLQNALRSVMIDDKETVNQIFSENGPLFQFGPKIRMAYVLGIYDRMIYDDLLKVSRVRNDFAHKVEARNFKWDRIRSAVLSMRVFERFEEILGVDYYKMAFEAAGEVDPAWTKGEISLNARFGSCVFLLGILIESKHSNNKGTVSTS